MRFLLSVFPILFLFSWLVVPTSASAQAEKELLSDAIKTITQINPDLDIKEKLTRFENALGKLDKITNNHAATDIGIALLSGQKIGEFDPQEMRSKYLDLLFEYQDTVCEVAPSYLCLGYVSLKIGIQQCKAATVWGELIDAHNSLLNAQRIFISQRANPHHSKIALSSYRSCSSQADTLGKDYFTYLLIKELIKQNNGALAKGLIQNTETPHYKFIGILELKNAEGKKVNKKYILRLVEYMNEKLGGYGVTLAKQEFMMFYLTNAEESVRKKMSVLDLRDRITARGTESAAISENICVPWVQFASFDQEINFRKVMFNTSNTPGGVKDLRRFFGDGIDRGSKPEGKSGELPWMGLYEPCLQNGKPLKLAIALFTQILFEKGEKKADALIQYVRSGLRSQADLLDFYMDIMITDVSQITGHAEDDDMMGWVVEQLEDPSNDMVEIPGGGFDNCYQDIENAMIKAAEDNASNTLLKAALMVCGVKEVDEKAVSRATALQFVENYRMGEEGHYQLLRKLVDFGSVCKAAEILFGNVGRESEYFPNAINYMVNSPQVDPEIEYACGDAELETLLD